MLANKIHVTIKEFVLETLICLGIIITVKLILKLILYENVFVYVHAIRSVKVEDLHNKHEFSFLFST